MDYRRIAGAAGLSFVGLVVAANVAIGASGKPGGGASFADIGAYYAEHGGASLLAASLAPLIWIALLLFAVGVLTTTWRSGRGPQPWAVVGLAGAIMQNAIFAGVIASDTILAVRADTLAAAPEFGRALWDLHTALFTLNGASLTLALGGFSLAALASGAAPRWLNLLGLLGALLLLGSALLTGPALAGSGIAVGLPGFLLWLLWIAGYGLTMLRGAATRTVPAPA